MLGTPSYLAPECVTGGAATAASDLYAVGVVLYEALSGCRPFAGETPLALCHSIVSDAPRPLRDLRPGVSAAAAAVVARAMAKDPRDRYRSAEDMMRALDGGAVPAVPALDEPTQLFDADPTLRANAVATIALEPTARTRTRAGVVALLVAGVAAVVIALMLGVGSHGSGSANKPTVTTGVTAPSTTVATTAATVSTVAPAPISNRGPGNGNGNGGPGHGGGHGKPKPPKSGGPGPG